MTLRGKPAEAVSKRLKLFMFGPAGIGKTTAAIQFPNSYVIDCEKGAENYDKLLNESGSVLFQTTDMDEVIHEVKALLTEKHEYRTLVIDPITTIFNDLLEKCESKVGSDWGRHYAAANKSMKRLANLIMALDMNVVVTAHAKNVLAQNLSVVGQTFDGWKQLDYWFDLVIELSRSGKGNSIKRIGHVVKTRLAAFPDTATFEWSYDEIKNRCDAGQLERTARIVNLATDEQLHEIHQLTSVVMLPEGTVEKWFAKAGVEAWDDMPADTIGKCIAFLKSRCPDMAAV
jgi:hypothetical protein